MIHQSFFYNLHKFAFAQEKSNSMLERLSAYFERIGVATTASSNYAIASLIVAAFVVAFLLNQIFKRISIGVFHRLAKRTTSDFDNILLEKRVPHNLANLITLLFLLWVLLSFFQSNEAIQWTVKVVEALLTFNFIIILRGILNSFKVVLSRVPLLKDKPIDSYVQVLMIFLWFIGSIIVLSILTGKSVGTFLTALGALSAVLLLIFKDTILGFVASIQISVNDTVRIGDWITMKNMGADGDVIAINLSSVQVQNFDKTITTIPTYKLLSDPFINWRGMSESQGRRLKRVLYIQAATVRFLSDEELKELQKVERLRPYVQEKEVEIKTENQEKAVDKSLLINGRNFTNIGLFRQYISRYLEEHPQINHEMTTMCRQLAPTPQGIPLEVYAFISDKRWAAYEGIASDIFDHLLAAAPYFKLALFEFKGSTTAKL